MVLFWGNGELSDRPPDLIVMTMVGAARKAEDQVGEPPRFALLGLTPSSSDRQFTILLTNTLS